VRQLPAPHALQRQRRQDAERRHDRQHERRDDPSQSDGAGQGANCIELSLNNLRYTAHMRITISLIVALALATLASPAATTATAQTTKQKPPKVLTLTGCVERDATGADQFTLTDKTAGTKYRVTGKDFREYLGRPIQVDGGVVVKGLKISG